MSWQPAERLSAEFTSLMISKRPTKNKGGGTGFKNKNVEMLKSEREGEEKTLRNGDFINRRIGTAGK